MGTKKFSSADRKEVIRFLENTWEIQLTKIGTRQQKYLKDETGTRYCLFGGYGSWHGIPRKIVEAEREKQDDSVFVIAVRHTNRIDVYSGVLRLLVNSTNQLSHTSQDQYEFNFRIHADRLYIKEISGLVLDKVGTIPLEVENTSQ